MTRRALMRLLSFCVVTLFSASTITLPFVDAVLDHLHPTTAVRQADHLEHPGGCGAHAEHCLVSSSTATLPAHPGRPTAVVGRLGSRSTAPGVERSNPAPLRPALPPSRAPPLLPA